LFIKTTNTGQKLNTNTLSTIEPNKFVTEPFFNKSIYWIGNNF